MSPEIKKILEEVARYCEDQAIYDKLGKYGDFYYKIKKLLSENKIHTAMIDELNSKPTVELNGYIQEQVRLLHKDGIPVVIPGCPLPK